MGWQDASPTEATDGKIAAPTLAFNKGTRITIMSSVAGVFTQIDHPLAGDLLATLRDANTQSAEFRRASKVLSTLLVLEATRHLETRLDEVETPIQKTEALRISQIPGFAVVLRAGLGMLDAALELYPSAPVGFIGVTRDEKTAIAQPYYENLASLRSQHVFCLDPMLATGGSANFALEQLIKAGAQSIALVCIVAAPEGIAAVHERHPEVKILAAARDEGLDHRKFIVPGLGDFGDRLLNGDLL